ncbi:MAG: 30S ribosomal protein S17 [Candidatus Omnitrophota bacterium]|nr:30S ribosomal protein S17 [Candidatus Omnitrophota bacterium]
MEDQRNKRKERIGVVSSDKMNKTRVVRVERLVKHPKYERIVRYATKFKAHDEQNVSKEGDKVRIMETRPLSKEKRWTILEVIKS